MLYKMYHSNALVQNRNVIERFNCWKRLGDTVGCGGVAENYAVIFIDVERTFITPILLIIDNNVCH